MDSIFPFGLPFPTAIYLVLYVGTWIVHAIFMNYVLAGSCYLAFNSVFGGSCRLAAKMRSWMPFMLSMAITAGIAPLLFLQILYKGNFYTANILLFYRWMAILPTLIAGFYLLYLSQTQWVLAKHRIIRAGVTLLAFACFLFVAWSWVENHILSMSGEDTWREQFTGGNPFFVSSELLPRLSVWFTTAFPTMALIAGWQMWYEQKASNTSETSQPHIARLISGIGIAGWIVSALCIGLYVSVMAPEIRSVFAQPLALPFVILLATGSLLQFTVWIAVFMRRDLSRFWLILGSVGVGCYYIGAGVVRECLRLTTLSLAPEGLAPYFAQHAQSWQVAGVIAFFVVLIVNAGLIIYCITLTRNASSQGERAA